MSSRQWNKKSGLCILTGVVCLCGALILGLHNFTENQKAGESAREQLSSLQEVICEEKQDSEKEKIRADAENAGWEKTDQEAGNAEKGKKAVFAGEEQGVQVDGKWYIGYLSLPTLELELPVLRDWSYENLKTAPCRYAGSVLEGGLVIAAHNYERHFGKISLLQPGTRIYFTDTAGRQHSYMVKETDTLEADAVEEMKDKEWDLTLFTCTYGGQNRVAVRCMEETA